VKRVTLTALMLTALFASAIRLPASACVLTSAPIGKACRQRCCANKACCAESQKSKTLPSIPAAKDATANQQIVAIQTTNVFGVVVGIRCIERTYSIRAETIICVQPQLAVLCSFLI
jgi:hypothetical protein